MSVAFAGPEDLDYLVEKDHIGRDRIWEKISRREFIVARRDDRLVGFLRYGYFWDDVPFMYGLWVQEESRSEGFGTRLVSFWENEMLKLGYDLVLTSTLSTNVRAQQLYRRLGYKDNGCLIMPGDPLEVHPLEVLFVKALSEEV